MPFLNSPILRLETWFVRRTAFLRHERAPMLAAMFVPVLLGLISVCLGQDDNWDLKNYHWYNPYALLNGRLQVDMAPAQWQSYFNPLIDLPYYWLNQVLPGPVVGFLMGFVQGLDFVVLLAIVRLVLPKPAADGRLCVLLAVAGVCGAGYLSELGNTMGDNLSALFVLAALYLVLRHWEARAVVPLLLSGLVMGVGAGLKLTNATYAIALCVALLAVPRTIVPALAAAFIYACGVVAGMALSGGFWWLRMWHAFANPLFPQLNSVFKSPLARQVAVIDDFHLPRSAAEALFWPFVFTRDFTRVSELVFRQAIIPVVYLLAIVFVCRWLFEKFSGASPAARLTPRARFLLLFGLVGYLAWMKLFSIYRYLVPLELLAPLMAWMLIGRLAAPRLAARIGGWVLVLTTLVVFPFGTWGHAGWAAQSFSAQLPAIAHPASAIVFTAHAHPPMGWLATLLPHEARVISLGSGFPESPAYVERIQAAIASRPGPYYVMLAAARNEKAGSVRRKLEWATALGMTANPARCARLDKLLHRVRFQVQVKVPAPDGEACTLELQPQYVADLVAQDRNIVDAAQHKLGHYGLHIDAAGCRQYPAAIGTESYPVQWCAVTAGARP